MLVARRRDLDRNGPARRPPLPLVAEDEAPPQVEVPVEAEMLVDRAPLGRVSAPERDRVALDRGDVAGARLFEPAQIGASDPEATGDGDRLVVERPDERRDEVAGRLD